MLSRVLSAVVKPINSDDPELRDAICFVTGSGRFRLNPELVCVWISGTESGNSTCSIRAAAKEGLIKQRGGEQAAREVEAKLRKALVSGGSSTTEM